MSRNKPLLDISSYNDRFISFLVDFISPGHDVEVSSSFGFNAHRTYRLRVWKSAL